MTINPCKHHPDANGNDAPKPFTMRGRDFVNCYLCLRAGDINHATKIADDWNAANPLPEVKNG